MRVKSGNRELEKFFQTIDQAEWLEDPSAQAKAVAWFQEFRSLLSAEEANSALASLADRLSLPIARVRAIARLSSLPEISRALLCNPKRGPLPRTEEDEMYPTEGWLGDYLNYAAGNESHTSWHFWTAVAVLGGACRRNFYLDAGNYYIYPNHYVMLLGPSGSKKGAALGPGHDLLERTNYLLSQSNVHPADLVAISPRKVVAERLLHLIQARKITDPLTNTERWADSVAFFPISELSVLLGKSVFHSDHFIHILTDLYDCPALYVVSTFKRGDEVLRNVAISLVACTTEDWLEEATSHDFFTGGFMGRCVVLPRHYSNKEYATAEFLDPVVRDKLAKHLVALATAQPRTLRIPAEDDEWYREWYHQNKQTLRTVEDRRLQGYYSRRHTHLIRLAMVLSLAESAKRTYLADGSLQIADTILSHEETYLHRALTRLGKPAQARVVDRVLRIINSCPDGISRTDLSRRTHGFTGGKQVLDRAIDTLRDQGKIKIQMLRKARWYTSLCKEDEEDG